MRPVQAKTSYVAEKKLWEHALSQVCNDECEELLRMMKEEKNELAVDVAKKCVPFAQACANHMVQYVEAEILGCYSRSCGWNGKVCTLWPFFGPEEKKRYLRLGVGMLR